MNGGLGATGAARAAVAVLALAAAASFPGCDQSATSLFAPPAAGLVRGSVTAVDGNRPPGMRLTLTSGSTTLETQTDAGGLYAFPAVAIGAWTLELGPIPGGWRLAAGQLARRLVLVVQDEIVREDFVVERVP